MPLSFSLIYSHLFLFLVFLHISLWHTHEGRIVKIKEVHVSGLPPGTNFFKSMNQLFNMTSLIYITEVILIPSHFSHLSKRKEPFDYGLPDTSGPMSLCSVYTIT